MRVVATLMRSLGRLRLRYVRESTRGSAAIEFALIAPVFFLMLFGIIETGVIYFATAMLQNATDDTARMIRVGTYSGTLDGTTLRNQICSEVNGLITASDCKTNLQIDLRAFSNFSGASYPNVIKSDGTVDGSQLTIDATQNCEVVLLRSFYPWKIMTPLMSTLLENTTTGQYLVTSSAAFRTEPYTSDAAC